MPARFMAVHQYALKINQHPGHPSFETIFEPKLQAAFLNRANLSWTFGVKIRSLVDNYNFPIDKIIQDVAKPPPWQIPSVRCDFSLGKLSKESTPPNVFLVEYYHHIQQYRNYTFIFTDGSKTANGVGCSYILGPSNIGIPLPGCCSIYTAELYAIKLALEAVSERTDRRILLLSDSLSSLQAIQSMSCDNVLIWQILCLMYRIQQSGKMLSFLWIPSHVSIAGNEKADTVAKSSANSDTPSVLKVPWSDLKPLVREHTLTQWQSEWSNSAPCKMLEIKPLVRPWKHTNLNCRLHEVYLTRLRIGHCYDTHFHLFHGQDPIECVHCGVTRSVKHVLVECQSLANLRQHFFGFSPGAVKNLQHYIGEDPIEIKQLIAFLNHINFRVIYRV